ncbi:retrovirus-related Pol polyprotein from transposon 17.6 [Trichonephila clavipes]|nr:retrovirus-related Pol polyprotein from transposon 17.6 [Trichonephila clavipes]
MKTVTYRPQTNLTERVNRNLVQMIACFVKENHENWDRFLHEFAFALRTSANETINKTPAELFLGRKIITPFSKLINITEGAEYVGRSICYDLDGLSQVLSLWLVECSNQALGLSSYSSKDHLVDLHAETVGGGDRGRVAIYRPFGEFHRAKIALSPVWCSRPTTGVPLAHATMNFVGLDLTTSDRWHQKTIADKIIY